MKKLLCLLLLLPLLCPAVSAGAESASVPEAQWRFGFAKRTIRVDESAAGSLYIAGYHNGVKITGVLDFCEARAVWIDAGGEGVLLIGVDCVALDSGTVGAIREALAGLPGCLCVNVYATHTHAGPDTLGLWGPVGINGKNAAYMEALKAAAVEAAREAAASPRAADLYYGRAETRDMLRDSREPAVCDEALTQLRFEPRDGSAGLRLLFYGAHAESLRGDNTLLSRDYPGALCDGVAAASGDEAMFFPGAVGGLVMTRLFVSDMPRGAAENMRITAEKLAGYALSVGAGDERRLEPRIRWARREFAVPLDNPVFLTYKVLGILNSRAVPGESASGYCVQTELGLLVLDDVALALIPGEIFPELVTGEAYGNAAPSGANPPPLRGIARDGGLGELLIVGLANDELGYVVPPSDFLVNDKLPYLERIRDAAGEDHYEETNSVGPACAGCVAEAFEAAVRQLQAVGP